MGQDRELRPDLAVYWSCDPTSFSWSVHLRNGSTFHDK